MPDAHSCLCIERCAGTCCCFKHTRMRRGCPQLRHRGAEAVRAQVAFCIACACTGTVTLTPMPCGHSICMLGMRGRHLKWQVQALGHAAPFAGLPTSNTACVSSPAAHFAPEQVCVRTCLLLALQGYYNTAERNGYFLPFQALAHFGCGLHLGVTEARAQAGNVSSSMLCLAGGLFQRYVCCVWRAGGQHQQRECTVFGRQAGNVISVSVLCFYPVPLALCQGVQPQQQAAAAEAQGLGYLQSGGTPATHLTQTKADSRKHAPAAHSRKEKLIAGGMCLPHTSHKQKLVAGSMPWPSNFDGAA